MSRNKILVLFLVSLILIVLFIVAKFALLPIMSKGMKPFSPSKVYVPNVPVGSEGRVKVRAAIGELFGSYNMAEYISPEEWLMISGRDSSFLFRFEIDQETWFDYLLRQNNFHKIEEMPNHFVDLDVGWVRFTKSQLSVDGYVWASPDDVGEFMFWIVSVDEKKISLAGVRREIYTKIPTEVWDIYR